MSTRVGTAWTVARRLALSLDRGQRWRQFSMALSSLLGSFTILLGLSVVWAGFEASAHLDARDPVLVQPGEDPRLLLGWTGPVLHDFSQIDILWLDPVAPYENDPDIVPPGLRRMPTPGEAVLSPGFVDAGYTAEDFGLRTGTSGGGPRGTIGEEGLTSLSEGLVYARPEAGRHLDADRVAPVLGYGGDGYRYRATIRLVVALETTVLAGLGALLALSVWAVLITGRQRFPVADGVLLTDATRVPLAAVAGGLTLAVLLAVLGAQVNRIPPRRATERTRPVDAMAIAPLAVSLLVMYLANDATRLFPDISSEVGLIVLFAGAIGVLASLPLAVPAFGALLARRLGQVRRPEVWLAVQRVAVRTRLLARPAAMVGALVFVAGSAFAVIHGTGGGNAHSHPTAEGVRVFSLLWTDQRSGDAELLRRRVTDAGAVAAELEVIPVESTTVRPGEFQLASAAAVRFDTCAAAAEFFGVTQSVVGCADDPQVPPQHLMVDVLSGRSSGIETAPSVVNGGALISSPTDWSATDVLALTAGLGMVDVVLEAGPPSVLHHPGVDWVAAGLSGGSIVLLVALVQTLGDRVVRSGADVGAPIRTGLTLPEANRIVTWSMLIPVAVAAPVGFLAACLVALRGLSIGLTDFNLALLSVAAATATGLSLAVIGIALALSARLPQVGVRADD